MKKRYDNIDPTQHLVSKQLKVELAFQVNIKANLFENYNITQTEKDQNHLEIFTKKEKDLLKYSDSKALLINKIDTLEKELNSLQENLRKKNEIIYNLDREKKDLDISYENVQFDLQNFKIN